jgi:hypothetical protein
MPIIAEAATAKEPVDEEAPCQSLPRLRASGPAGAPPPLPLPSAAQLLNCSAFGAMWSSASMTAGPTGAAKAASLTSPRRRASAWVCWREDQHWRRSWWSRMPRRRPALPTTCDQRHDRPTEGIGCLSPGHTVVFSQSRSRTCSDVCAWRCSSPTRGSRRWWAASGAPTDYQSLSSNATGRAAQSVTNDELRPLWLAREG